MPVLRACSIQLCKAASLPPRRIVRKPRTSLRISGRTGAEIYFVDESAVRSDHHRGSTWAPIGQTPVVEDSGDRFTLKLISAVSPRGDMRFSVIQDKMNSGKFIAFVKKLLADA